MTPTTTDRTRRAWKRAHNRRPWRPEDGGKIDHHDTRTGGFEHISGPLRRVLARIEAVRRERDE